MRRASEKQTDSSEEMLLLRRIKNDFQRRKPIKIRYILAERDCKSERPNGVKYVLSWRPPPPAWHDNVMMDGWGARPLR